MREHTDIAIAIAIILFIATLAPMLIMSAMIISQVL